MKPSFLFLVSGLWLLVSHSARAIIDTNTNEISDYWEKQHNSGALFPANFDIHDDPDADGWTNLEEAAAGTNPFDPNPPNGFLRPQITHIPAVMADEDEDGIPDNIITPETVTINWATLIGKKYRLLFSADLSEGSWLVVGTPFIGNGTVVEYGVPLTQPDGTVPDSLFWRVAIEDTDTDGDTLSDHEESILETAANHPDTDLDGLTDNVDPLPLLSATLADPDGSNPPAGSLTNLRGFWDFETQVGTTSPAIFPDRSGSNRLATSSGPGPQPLGIPSLAGSIGPDHITIPASTVQGQAVYTVSGWFKLAKNSIASSNGLYRVLYSLYDQQGTGSAPQYAPLAEGTILAIRKLNSTTEQWYLGGYKQTTFYNQPPNTNGNATTILNGHIFTQPAGKSDDGRWHHFAATRSTSANGQKLYLDGQLVIEEPLAEYPVSYDSDTTFTLGRLYPGHAPTSLPDARIDRLRVHSKMLSQTEVTALYLQDIDRDGLWDVTETRSALWRDLNSDGSSTASEISYFVSPFHYDPPAKDHDKDGILTLDEQTLGTRIDDADTDDDGLPDGYDMQYGLGPLVPDTNLDTDADNDGLTLAQELSYGTNPNLDDTDGDHTKDGIEVTHDGRPNDVSDGGNPPDPANKLTVRLAIGDQSGSESENYHLVAYRYDPVTRVEDEIYRLRSGGFGRYSGNKDISIFRRDEEYTFRIHWQGSNLGSRAADPYGGITAEGPDYDYTMKVETVGDETGAIITDAFDVAAGVPENGYQLLGVHNDVGNFQTIADTLAVHEAETYIDLAVDTNMNGTIESLPDGVNAGSGWPGSKIDDRLLDDSNPPRPVVIDVNNNNTDASMPGSATKDQVDNENTILDNIADKTEMTGAKIGHSFGKLRVYAYPVEKLKTGQLALRLSFPDAGHAGFVRVFDWRGYNAGAATPTELLGPGKTSATLDHILFFDSGFNPTNAMSLSYRELVMEGITYGTAVLKLELITSDAVPKVISSDEVRVTVNVDRFAQKPGEISGKKDARHLRGTAPHRMGIRKTGLATTGLRAIRGNITARIPASGNYSRLTPMKKNTLKENSISSTDENSGASLWVGFTLLNTQGGLEQWVQTGLRWVQPASEKKGSIPAIYLESGDTYNGLNLRSLNQAAAPGTNSEWLGNGVNSERATLLGAWNTAPVKYSFILFKKPVATDAQGMDDSYEPWQLIVKDARAGQTITNSSYVYLRIGDPTPASTVGPVNAENLDKRYRGQQFLDVDALFETNQSITFTAGSSDQHAAISGLQVALGYTGVPPASPNLGVADGKLHFYNWADAAFNWESVTTTTGDLRAEIRTGKSLPDGAAETGNTAHPNWHSAVSGGGFEIWDNRPYGFEN